MKEFEFSLVLDGDDLLGEASLEAFFEAGCDDATFGAIDGVVFAEFARQAPDLVAALATAVRDVESVPGVRVARVEPDDLVTAAEIAARVGLSREAVRLWIQGARGPGGFPPPTTHLRSRMRLWRWAEVARWLDGAGVAQAFQEVGDASFVAALNDALELRALLPQLQLAERSTVTEVLASVR